MPATTELTPPGGTPKPSQLSLVGRRVDHYVLQEELGQGGMSVVYRARDEVLQRDVAIKVLHPFLADRPDARRRLGREARAVAKLRHANILEVYGFSGEDATPSFIAMELVRGETLKQFAERERIYPCEVAAAVAWVVAGALEHAHDAGVIHRDVKPENIMLRQDGVLKLMDFGIAHVVDNAHLTITGTLQGSPAHMAPEVIEGAEVDIRADLFSLGTVLFWMTTGQLPFVAKTPHALLKRIVEGRYTEPQRLNAEISDRMAGVIRKSLARDPKDRFATAGDLRGALREIWEEGGLEDPAVALPLFFRNPQKCRAEWSELAAERFVAQAHTHLKAGDRIKALSAVNRVLALKPAHPEAPALMKRIEQSSRAAGRLRVGLGVGLILAVATAAVTVAEVVDRHNNADAHQQPPPDPSLGPDPGKPTPGRKPPVSLASRPRTTVRLPARGDPAAPAPTVAAVVHPPASGTATAEARHPVVFRVDPWADVEVDGQVVARGKKVTDLDLTPGMHHVRFLHAYGQTEERQLTVPADGPPLDIPIRIRPKPAYLLVRSPEDPEVFINGINRGGARQSEREPILVPLTERSWEARVVVGLRKLGKESVEFEKVVRAGETTEVDVQMRDAESTRPVLEVQDPPPADPASPSE